MRLIKTNRSSAGFGIIEVVIAMGMLTLAMSAFASYMQYQGQFLTNLETRGELNQFREEVKQHLKKAGVCAATFQNLALNQAIDPADESTGRSPASNTVEDASGATKYETATSDPNQYYGNGRIQIRTIKIGDWVSDNAGDITVTEGDVPIVLYFEGRGLTSGGESRRQEYAARARVTSGDPTSVDYKKIIDCWLIDSGPGGAAPFEGTVLYNQQYLAVNWKHPSCSINPPAVCNAWRTTTNVDPTLASKSSAPALSAQYQYADLTTSPDLLILFRMGLVPSMVHVWHWAYDISPHTATAKQIYTYSICSTMRRYLTGDGGAAHSASFAEFRDSANNILDQTPLCFTMLTNPESNSSENVWDRSQANESLPIPLGATEFRIYAAVSRSAKVGEFGVSATFKVQK